MAKKHNEYWRERFQQLEEARHKDIQSLMPDIDRIYKQAQAEMEKEIRAWYQRLADNNGVSMAEARKLLSRAELEEFKWTVEEYIKRGKENAIDQRWMKKLENASARFHINRLEALKLQVQQSLEAVYGNQLDQLDTSMRELYQDSYYRTAFELQKGFQIGFPIAAVDQNKLDKIIQKPWAPDGKNFSDRIWESKAKLVREVHTELTRMCITGVAPDTAIRNIAKKMNTSRYNAGRLVMTEAAYFGSESQKDCFNDLNVEQYEICATLDSHTSDICQGMDGKVFDMKDYEAGVTAPPFHVFCRTCTVPYFHDEFTEGELRAARGADGKTYYVPADMKYSEWKKAFVDGDKSGLQNASGKPKTGKTKAEPPTKPKIDYQLDGMKERSQKRIQEAIEDLMEQYRSPLKTVGRGSSRKGIKGETDILGERIDFMSSQYQTIAHEFFHTLTSTRRRKAGLGDAAEDDFWKEIRAVRKRYRKAVSDGTTRSISAYAETSVDEFAAEAFGQYKAIEKGVKMDWGMGTDTTFSKEVVDIVDKYFGKGTTKVQKSGIIKTAKSKTPAGILDKSKQGNDLKSAIENFIDGTNPDREALGKQILAEYHVKGVPVYVKGMPEHGHCLAKDNNGILEITGYSLNKNDKRSAIYQVKTAFHEAYHASGNGYATDYGKMNSNRWHDLEETFAESTAHYMMHKCGITDLAFSYPDKLVKMLPRLKKLPEFAGCSTISDFGRVAQELRQKGGGSVWKPLSQSAMKKKFDFGSYTKQYFPEIRKDLSEYVDKILENIPDSIKSKNNMIAKLEDAMNHVELYGFTLSEDESFMLNNAVAVAMNRMGVK